MYSFYGGQPGNSFVIITTYRSIADMKQEFQKGPEYTAVHFDQYVMINTVDKNNPDNGKIYRRGYNFNNDMGGAEFVGTIVGPAGNAPMLQMSTVADIRRKATGHDIGQGYEERHSSGSYSLSGANLVPGKNIDGTFNDAITWECYSIRNENNEDTTAYIGFTFPYHVIDIETDIVQPYIMGRYADVGGAYRNDDYTHPFYEKWNLKIPRGIKGDSFKNLKVQVADETIEPYDGQAEDINNQNEVMVYQYYNYSDYKNGNPKKYYLGNCNAIKNIDIAQDGTITIFYYHFTKTFNKMIKWINSLSIDNNGLLVINYNTGETQNINLNIPNNIKINTGEIEGTGNQKINIGWTNGDNIDIGKPINYIMETAINNDQHLLIRYSDPIRRGRSDTVTWNNKDGWTDIGSLKVPYIYTDPTATNLQWSGLGILTNSNETLYMNINFTVPLTQFIDSNINLINILNGKLYVKSQDGTYDLTNVTLDSTNTIVTKTLTGLNFQIQTTFSNLQTATTEIVSVLINEINLEFIRQTTS